MYEGTVSLAAFCIKFNERIEAIKIPRYARSRYSGNRIIATTPSARVAMKWRIEGPNGFAD